MNLYDELSRKSLISMCNAYDKEHDSALLKYAEEQDAIRRYPRIKPFYFQVEKVEAVYDKANGKVTDVVDGIIGKADAIVSAISASTNDKVKATY